MYETIKNVHSILAYAALGLLLLASFNAIFGLSSKKIFKDKDLWVFFVLNCLYLI